MATITEDYVSFETAKLLKEKGFDELTLHYYVEGHLLKHYSPLTNSDTAGISAPTHQTAMKWLREVHNIYYEVQLLLGDKAAKYGDLQLGVYQLSSSGAYIWKCCLYADTYEELYEKYIKFCLKNLI